MWEKGGKKTTRRPLLDFISARRVDKLRAAQRRGEEKQTCLSQAWRRVAKKGKEKVFSTPILIDLISTSPSLKWISSVPKKELAQTYVPCYVSPAVPLLAGNKQHFLSRTGGDQGVMERWAVFSTSLRSLNGLPSRGARKIQQPFLYSSSSYFHNASINIRDGGGGAGG